MKLLKNSIDFSISYDHPVAAVWAALTNADALSQWLMPCDFQPVVGHKFQFRTEPSVGFDGIINCEVLEIIEKEKLVLSWSGGKNMSTVVTFQLTDQSEKTLLEFQHTGFQGIFEQLVVRKILANGWLKTILSVNLPKYLQQ